MIKADWKLLISGSYINSPSFTKQTSNPLLKGPPNKQLSSIDNSCPTELLSLGREIVSEASCDRLQIPLVSPLIPATLVHHCKITY